MYVDHSYWGTIAGFFTNAINSLSLSLSLQTQILYTYIHTHTHTDDSAPLIRGRNIIDIEQKLSEELAK